MYQTYTVLPKSVALYLNDVQMTVFILLQELYFTQLQIPKDGRPSSLRFLIQISREYLNVSGASVFTKLEAI